ncbi:MAG: baseplate J/gp47 family protein [Prevotellaceae bacterium]|jgi:phage-related baseplate assembly protein|nr:baseplate J/gp47 family protein [Prevotellaceae bacterium]
METEIPVFVERDPDTIMAECTAKLEELLERTLQPAQVEQLMLQFIVYREVLLVNRFNAGMSQMLYQFSKAPVLDYIAALVAVERLPPATAGCTIKFSLDDEHGEYGPTIIPAGTRVATSDGAVIFSVPDDIIIESDVLEVEVDVEAEEAGKSGNGYQPGMVNKILDPLAFVLTVENINTTGGGSDEETDEQLRERIRLSPSQYSTAGSRASYEYHARSANPTIIDISVTSPTPGTVVIVPLIETGAPPEEVLADIENVCSAENVRPLTDTVEVKSPMEKEYEIVVWLTLYEGADAVTVKAAVLASLTKFAEEKRRKLGKDIIRSHIAQLCRIADVYDVAVNTPAENIIVNADEFSNCTKIEVNIMGYNNG